MALFSAKNTEDPSSTSVFSDLTFGCVSQILALSWAKSVITMIMVINGNGRTMVTMVVRI